MTEDVNKLLKQAHEALKFYYEELPKWDYEVNGKPDGSMARDIYWKLDRLLNNPTPPTKPEEWVGIKQVVYMNGKPWKPHLVEYTPCFGYAEWHNCTMEDLLLARWSASFDGAVEKKEIKE